MSRLLARPPTRAGDPRRLPARGRRGRGAGRGAPGRAARCRPRRATSSPCSRRSGSDGKPAKVDFPKGSKTVLLFFLSGCPSCHKMIPEWNRAYERRPKGLKIVGVIMDPEQAPPASGPRWPISFPVLRSPGREFLRTLNVNRAPLTLRVGEGGKIEDLGLGSRSTPSAWESSSSPEERFAPRGRLRRVPGEDRAQGRQRRERLRSRGRPRSTRRRGPGGQQRGRPKAQAQQVGEGVQARRHAAAGGRARSSARRACRGPSSRARRRRRRSCPCRCAGKGSQGSTDRRQSSWWTKR